MQHSFKFYDTIFGLLEMKAKNMRVKLNSICEELLDVDKQFEKHYGTPLSIKAKKKFQQAYVGKGQTKPNGVWNEHILSRKKRAEKMLDMIIHDGATRKCLEKYIWDSWYVVYKLKEESEEAEDAHVLLSEENQKEINYDTYTIKR